MLNSFTQQLLLEFLQHVLKQPEESKSAWGIWFLNYSVFIDYL